ncbi:MAG: hypothetical protein JWO13_2542 [Acidobacteriales bacterium]|nr:hypothetical protein [Terriglobales bacterium]
MLSDDFLKLFGFSGVYNAETNECNPPLPMSLGT